MAETTVTIGGKERIPPFSTLYSATFAQDPIITYMLCTLTPSQRLDYLPKYFHSLLTAAALNRGSFAETEDRKSCAVVMPPGSDVGNVWTLVPAGLFRVLWVLGLRGCQRMLVEFEGAVNACRAKFLAPKEKFYYFFFIATDEKERGKGLAARIIRYYQDVARREGTALWLEATTEKSMRLYARLGFELVEVMVLGKGNVGEDGVEKKDGEGVRLWGMVWRPGKEDVPSA